MLTPTLTPNDPDDPRTLPDDKLLRDERQCRHAAGVLLQRAAEFRRVRMERAGGTGATLAGNWAAGRLSGRDRVGMRMEGVR